ncbi:DnaB-like helicase C-terminal domain-containing protein [Clostridium sp. OS1-26]|uniref:DnaB-like helicase C-terminal domain-containing protein n=1 Tax=Clostridium sp. OS1-26 TaxID=3070681 RepID=UPI0027E14784|nr:DnaB-like helicase C-terminal domain-containing protein [Clostridium sp. OS1-26]WML36742.1 DnaB-like helicase C-terminal domain-containing protein [Clostridium sp. OS1-26]
MKNRAPIDIITFCSSTGEGLKDIGGMSYISNIIAAAVTVQNIKSYAQIVKEKSSYRELLKILETSKSKLEKEEASTAEVIEYAQNSLMQLDSTDAKESGEMLCLMDKYMDTLQTRYEKGGEIQGLKTGHKSLDKLIGGLQKEDLIILAARPSMRKTAVALNLIIHSVLKENVKTAFFNLEMGPMLHQPFQKAI